MKRTKRIEIILKEEFYDFTINIIDNSFLHKGHTNFDGEGETHIAVMIQKNKESKVDRLAIHKKINSLLNPQRINAKQCNIK